MSKIQGKPFIELVVDTLGNLKTDFLDLVNGSDKTPEFRSLINASAKITGSDKGKVQYVVLETWSKTYTGYLIYNNTYCVLVAFSSNTQALTMLKIDVAKQTFITVKEYLDINELRRYLEEASEHITSGEIDSGEAEANALLVADGDGGAEFVSPEDGSAQYLLGLDSEGNIIKDELPEGIVVDQTIVEDSENAVAGGAVYDALASVNNDIDALEEEMETKANVDGNYPTMTVGMADNLTPYDESAGDDQDEPFSFQATGTGNGSQPDFSTGSIALMKEKQGNTVVVNQKISGIVATKTVNGVTFTNNNDGTMTINGTASAEIGTGSVGEALSESSWFARRSHYSLVSLSNENLPEGFTFGVGGYSIDKRKSFIFYETNDTDWNGRITCHILEGTVINNLKVRPFSTDLTQWFNGDIPQDLLDNPENFYRYYQGSLAYNEGTLVNANGRYIKCIGMNQWDEEWEVGAISISNGENVSVNDQIRCKNYIKVIPNAQYYGKTGGNNPLVVMFYDKDKNLITGIGSGGENYIGVNNDAFTVPSNASYLRFYVVSSYGTTYNNDISINLYYEDEPRCLTYEPYEVLTNNDTGTEVLRSAGSVKDSKAPDGTIARDVGTETFVGATGESWNRAETNDVSTKGYYFYIGVTNAVNVPNGSTKSNISCNIFRPYDANHVYGGGQDEDGYVSFWTSNSRICIYSKALKDMSVADFKTWLSTHNLTVNYELAEPTEEQGTPYSEKLVIDDFGSMDFGGTNGVPQGNLIFYPVDYKAFVDTLYKYTDGTPSNIALKSDLPTAPQTWAESLPGYDATKTQTLKNVNGTLTWVDDE